MHLFKFKVAKKQERRGSQTRVAGLNDIIKRLGGSPLASEAYGKWRGEAHKRDSLDKILSKFGKKDNSEGSERSKGSKDNKEEDKKEVKEKRDQEKEENEEEKEVARSQGSLKRSRGEAAFNTKRMRPNAANIYRQDVKVETE